MKKTHTTQKENPLAEDLLIIAALENEADAELIDVLGERMDFYEYEIQKMNTLLEKLRKIQNCLIEE
jgi:hypothetical protein